MSDKEPIIPIPKTILRIDDKSVEISFQFNKNVMGDYSREDLEQIIHHKSNRAYAVKVLKELLEYHQDNDAECKCAFCKFIKNKIKELSDNKEQK